MKPDIEKIKKSITALRDVLVDFLKNGQRDAVISQKLNSICSRGSEVRFVESALFSDCLICIESIVFAGGRYDGLKIEDYHGFLRGAAKSMWRIDPEKYSDFYVLSSGQCRTFLEVHFEDASLFGGTCRKSSWAGFQVTQQLCNFLDCNGAVELYRSIIEDICLPLINDDQSIDSFFELSGIWGILSEKVASNFSNVVRASAECVKSEVVEFQQVDKGGREFGELCEKASLNSSSLLFEVISTPSREPKVQINTDHMAFQNERSLELLLNAWGRMEHDAFGGRKQLLSDIRNDWGRKARDLYQGDEVIELSIKTN